MYELTNTKLSKFKQLSKDKDSFSFIVKARGYRGALLKQHNIKLHTVQDLIQFESTMPLDNTLARTDISPLLICAWYGVHNSHIYDVIIAIKQERFKLFIKGQLKE